MARLLVLGSSAFQVPAIKRAVALGHHVATCDYFPGNPGRLFAHESFNVSTTDADAVLALARDLSIDGILAFASDPAAPTAAYVAARMELAGCSVEAVRVLTDKLAFRGHLRKHGFKVPAFTAINGLQETQEAARAIGYPVMVKPCDSSGSKGISRVEKPAAMSDAYRLARHHSRSGAVIVERWIGRRGPQIAGDGLVIGGHTVFGCFGDEHFDPQCSAHAPVGESFPGELGVQHRDELFLQLDRLFASLGVRELVFNLDAMVDEDDDLMLIEVGPRAGGNCLPQVIQDHVGVDLTEIAIRLALGEPVSPSMYAGKPSGFHASWMIHARVDGRLRDYHVASELKSRINELQFLVERGATVRKFTSSSDTLGYARFAFAERGEMAATLSTMGALLRAEVE